MLPCILVWAITSLHTRWSSNIPCAGRCSHRREDAQLFKQPARPVPLVFTVILVVGVVIVAVVVVIISEIFHMFLELGGSEALVGLFVPDVAVAL